MTEITEADFTGVDFNFSGATEAVFTVAELVGADFTVIEDPYNRLSLQIF